MNTIELVEALFQHYQRTTTVGNWDLELGRAATKYLADATDDALRKQLADARHLALELSGVIAEYKAMPCFSLEERMFQTLLRYGPRLNHLRAEHFAAMAEQVEPNHD
jgi:hypothetical protein